MPTSTDATRLGINRTGLQMSPQHAKEMLDAPQEFESGTSEQADTLDGEALSATRLEYIADADPLGSVPAPATLKGAAKSGAKMLTGRRPQVFIDKLAERLAFERGGTRLYDAVCAKAIAHTPDMNEINPDELLEIRNSEARHASLIKECMETLGADPTAQTPCADLVGVETMGLLQAVSDPRTTLAQTLHAALAAELIDNQGWEDLIVLARELGHDDMAKRFKTALDEEAVHLTKVRNWHTLLTMETSELM
ncbi:MAG TPA: ferritin-like domain-containing protein [Steroidobacter sp.]|uniref:ferritin-like domain-containing protein n=1 Tax=Steroidobacter sp. TaxID=1978227 RepID=UPI002ED93F61